MKCYGNYFNASGSRAEHMVSDATFVLKTDFEHIDQTKFPLWMKNSTICDTNIGSRCE